MSQYEFIDKRVPIGLDNPSIYHDISKCKTVIVMPSRFVGRNERTSTTMIRCKWRRACMYPCGQQCGCMSIRLHAC